MRLKHGLLKKMNEVTGYKIPYLCDLVATRKRPGSKRALKLETLTGVHHDLWLYHPSEDIKRELNKMEI